MVRVEVSRSDEFQIRSGDLFEGALDPVYDGGWSIIEVVADFEDSGRRIWKPLEGFEGGGPVNGAIAGPQVFVPDAVIVVNMELSDALAENADGLGNSGSDVSVAEVEADVDLVKMGH